MENNFDNRDFERFVRQNADQFRMFPSDKVWKGIHTALHKRRRWYGFGLALLLLTTATVTMVMLMPGSNSKLASVDPAAKQIASAIPVKPKVVTYIQATPASRNSSARSYPTHLTENYYTPAETVTTTTVETKSTEENIVEDHRTSADRELIRGTTIIPDNGHDVKIDRTTANDRNIAIVPASRLSNSINKANRRGEEKKSEVDNSIVKTDAITAAEKKKDEIKKDQPEEKKAEQNLLLPPYTIESVVNSYTRKKQGKKWDWEFYVTPTISYRSLTENTEFISISRYNSIMNGTGSTTNPVYFSTDVNSVVDHKPDHGIQAGLRAGYPLSKWLSLTGGFQLSVSKYDIKASQHTAEVATINLTTQNTLSTVANYRNGDGGDNWLRNYYFSASIPVGLELKLSDGERNYFGVGTTLQPTFVLDNRAYLITTDYKNYAEVPSLTRRFNMNTSFEIFTAHTTGKVHWRVGPQVHYQMMSSFIKNYPIKEHLFDFGLKLGIRLN